MLQKTPPPGWPHTEAEKYSATLHGAPPARGRLGSSQPPPPAHRPKSRIGCCLVVLMVLLAVVGIAVAVVVWALEDADLSEFDAATEAFLSQHPGWEVESVDRPDSPEDAVRLIAWDPARNIGRLVYMLPDTVEVNGWVEYPLIDSMEGDRNAEEAFLDAFAVTFGASPWTYAREVTAVDVDSDPQTFRVFYREWEQTSGEWTGTQEGSAQRDRGSTEWAVAPDSAP